MNDKEAEQLQQAANAQAAVRLLLRVTLDLLNEDSHLWSTRPCPTCRTISVIIDEDFGCVKYRKAREGSPIVKYLTPRNVGE